MHHLQCPGLGFYLLLLGCLVGAAARGEAESTKRSAAPQPATAATRSPQPAAEPDAPDTIAHLAPRSLHFVPWHRGSGCLNAAVGDKKV
jgi:hypothetical protein